MSFRSIWWDYLDYSSNEGNKFRFEKTKEISFVFEASKNSLATDVTHGYSYVKETCTYTKRDIYIHEKKHIHTRKEAYTFTTREIRDIYILATGLTHEYSCVKETCTYTKRDIYLYHKRHLQCGDRRNTWILVRKRDIYIHQKRHVHTIKETYTYT